MTRKILDLPVVSHSSKAVSILLLTCQSQIRLEHERYADWESNNVVTEEYDTSTKSLSAAASHNTNPTTLFYNKMKCVETIWLSAFYEIIICVLVDLIFDEKNYQTKHKKIINLIK